MRFLYLFAMASALPAADLSIAQQNDLMARYCAVCHTNATPNGGLTRENFDATYPSPQVAATGGDSGPGSIVLSAIPLPKHSLEVQDVFPGERITFPFDELKPADREALACFGK